jgi:hypothetical protein
MKKIIQYIGFGIVAILVVLVIAVIVLAEQDKKLETLLPIYTNNQNSYLF